MKRVLILSLTALSLLAGCGAKEEKTDKILLGEAKTYIEKQSYEDAKKDLSLLLDKYPQSPLTGEAKDLLKIVDSKLAEAKVEEQKRIKYALNRMRVQMDDTKTYEWYKDKSTPRVLSGSILFLDFSTYKGDLLYVDVNIYYIAQKWLYINSIVINADDKSFTYKNIGNKLNSRIVAGETWESYNVPIDNQKDYDMIKALISAKNSSVVFVGKKGSELLKITDAEKAAMQNVLDAYKGMGGKLDFKN